MHLVLEGIFPFDLDVICLINTSPSILPLTISEKHKLGDQSDNRFSDDVLERDNNDLLLS